MLKNSTFAESDEVYVTTKTKSSEDFYKLPVLTDRNKRFNAYRIYILQFKLHQSDTIEGFL
jgi:hypothetical protein